MENKYYIEFLSDGDFETRVEISKSQYEDKLREMNQRENLERHEHVFQFCMGEETLIWFTAPAFEVALRRYEVRAA